MFWEKTKKSVYIFIAALVVDSISMLFFGPSRVNADESEYEGRYMERFNGDNEWTFAVILFSPKFNRVPELQSLDVHSTVAIDSFSINSKFAWDWMHGYASELDESWIHATYIDADIVPVAHKYDVQEYFDAIFMLRENTFYDVYDLLDEGWRIGDLEHWHFNEVELNTLPVPTNLFEPRVFTPSQQNGRVYDNVEGNVIYRIPIEHVDVFYNID